PKPAGGHPCRWQSPQRAAGTESLPQRRPAGRRRGDRARPSILHARPGRKRYALQGGAVPEPVAAVCTIPATSVRLLRTTISAVQRRRRRVRVRARTEFLTGPPPYFAKNGAVRAETRRAT